MALNSFGYISKSSISKFVSNVDARANFAICSEDDDACEIPARRLKELTFSARRNTSI